MHVLHQQIMNSIVISILKYSHDSFFFFSGFIYLVVRERRILILSETDDDDEANVTLLLLTLPVLPERCINMQLVTVVRIPISRNEWVDDKFQGEWWSLINLIWLTIHHILVLVPTTTINFQRAAEIFNYIFPLLFAQIANETKNI